MLCSIPHKLQVLSVRYRVDWTAITQYACGGQPPAMIFKTLGFSKPPDSKSNRFLQIQTTRLHGLVVWHSERLRKDRFSLIWMTLKSLQSIVEGSIVPSRNVKSLGLHSIVPLAAFVNDIGSAYDQRVKRPDAFYVFGFVGEAMKHISHSIQSGPFFAI